MRSSIRRITTAVTTPVIAAGIGLGSMGMAAAPARAAGPAVTAAARGRVTLSGIGHHNGARTTLG